MKERTTIAGLLAATLAVGCAAPEPPDHPCPDVTVELRLTTMRDDKVDLLFMVDNSNSMAEEQASLAAELESMIRILGSGDFDQDGRLDGPDDFEPVRDLNVGIVTSDMGVGGHGVPTCDRADFGDDGVLRSQGRTDLAGCMATYPSFLNYHSDWHEDPATFAHDVSCVANVGTGGCGFEQQLEAVLKAVSPSAPQAWTSRAFVAPMFHMNTLGHADGVNVGFVRDDSVLAIVPVTDEEDCSAHDPEIFDPSSPTYGETDLNLRCWAHAEALHPIARYVDGLVNLRVSPNRLVYAPIVGVPTDLAQQYDEATMTAQPIAWDRLVGPTDGTRDERMVERLDTTVGTRLEPSCDVEGRGVAFPPVRIVRVARELEARGAGVTVQSICQESFAPALRGVIQGVAEALQSYCLPAELPRAEDGRVHCELDVAAPEGRACTDLAGAEPLLDDAGVPMTEAGRAICVVPQLAAVGTAPEGEGWYYDDFSVSARGCGGARTALTDALPKSPWRLRCVEPMTAENRFGAPCDPGDGSLESGYLPCGGPWIDGRQLYCDPVWRTCGVPCSSWGGCHGLDGYVCDDRPLNELHPGLASDAPHGFCVDPTCG